MRRLVLLATVAATLSPLTASAAKIYGPQGTNEAGVELALVDDTWADEGIGVGGHYDMVLVRSAGPGHVMGGGSALFVSTEEDDVFRGCDRDETIFNASGRVRYVLGVSPVVKPYVGIGMGLYAVSRDQDDCNNPDNDDEDTDLGIGIPVMIGLDFAFDNFSFGLGLTVHETSAGDDDDEDFSQIGLGVGWRF